MADRPAVLSERCATCIFRADTPFPAARVQEVIRGNLAAGALLMCHSTLYEQAEREAVCRGYWDAHRDRSNTARVLDRLSGGEPWWEEVPPPEH